MGRRFLAAWCVAIAAAWLVPAGAAGQSQAGSEDWTVSRTAWGDPRLRGHLVVRDDHAAGAARAGTRDGTA